MNYSDTFLIFICFSYTKFGMVSFLFWKEMKTFIQQEHIKLIETDSKDIYNITKLLFFWHFFSSKNPEKYNVSSFP